MVLSSLFEQSVTYANMIHGGQIRRKTGMPMMGHLLGVSSILLEFGGNEEEAIGGLLHDAAEEAGGKERLEDIRQRFGNKIAEIVSSCSDSLEDPRPPWRERKEAFVSHIRKASPSALMVIAADKLHNSQTLLQIYRVREEAVWQRYEGGRDGTLWYYRVVVQALLKNGPNPLVEELDRMVSEMEWRITR